MTPDAIGWIATAVFSLSYLFKSGATLRRAQAMAAILWIVYGVTISAKPVIVANVIVAVSALGSAISRRASREWPKC
ncbi:MAG: hypothetical protein EXQ47_06700 [Bryobacterales bacterium]|nr:hypothetical protein [Bryobacterales bacterium]